MTIGGVDLKSRVMTKIVLITEDDEICFCDKDFRKTCAIRISGNLPCRETIVRFTPVERDYSDNRIPEAITAIDSNLRNVKHSFMQTLAHLKRMK